MSTSPGGARSSASERAVLAVLLLGFLALAWRFWFVVDDAYISFRYAKHLAAGEGLRFNLGEHVPVEGYSNFLWVLVCAGIEALGLDLEVVPLILSLASGVLLIALVHRTLRQRLGVEPGPAALATASFALAPPVAVWGTSGLETMPFALLLFVTFERFVLRRGGVHVPSAAAAAFALALLRVEGLYWGVAIAGLALVVRSAAGERPTARVAAEVGRAGALLLVGYAVYFAWRVSYYGELVPNTVVVKGGFAFAHLGRGLRYVASHALTFVTPLLLLPAALCALRRERGLAVLAMALAVPVYALLVGGDYMAMGRFLVPGWAFAALLLGWLAQVIARRVPRALGALAGAGLLACQLLPAWDLHVVPEATRAALPFRHNTELFRSELEQWRLQKEHAEVWAACGRGLARWTEPGARVAMSAIGAKGYFSEAFVLDTGGLVTREVAELPPDGRLRSAGHDKSQPVEYFLKDQPDYLQPEVVPFGAALTEAVERGRRRLERARDQGQSYVVDFHPLPEHEPGGPRPHLVLWRRTR